MNDKTTRGKSVVAIVQARLGSSRLPMKSLLCLNGAPVIDWVCDRLARSARLSGIIVATPDTELDRVLDRHLQKRGIACFAGPENDVLSRYRQAAETAGADVVVRVCADNPLIWWEAIDRLIDFYDNGNYDYAYNHIPRGNLWPDGLGAEILSFDLLRQIDEKATLASQREHCLNYIWDNASQFKIATFDPAESWLRRPNMKLDIDTEKDFQKLALLNMSPDMDAREIVSAWAAGTA